MRAFGSGAFGPLGRTLRSRMSKSHLVGLLLLLGMLSAACANGTYPLDFFYEQHYQQSYSSHEPPRLSPPAGAVPISAVVYYSSSENPIPGERLPDGAALFATNCVICHGTSGNGEDPDSQGQVLKTMRERYDYPASNPSGDYIITPNLTSDTVRDQSDVTTFSWISGGVSGGVMPAFQKLLTVEQRWLLVNYIRGCLLDDAPECP